jgi:hypothetical protein
MNSVQRWLKTGLLSLVVLGANQHPAMGSDKFLPVTTSSLSPCSAPEYHQFDFWIGDWDAFDFDKLTIVVAHTRVDRILDGCVLRENYEGADGHQGQSFSIYDAARKVWHQSWVTNRGELLVIEGKLQGNEMVLRGVDPTGGTNTLVRGNWKPVSDGVRETAVKSTDGGETWKPWFDLVFRPTARRAQTDRPDKEEQIVAALDSDYRAAVKKNDAATIDHLLPDDFVLVTAILTTFLPFW